MPPPLNRMTAVIPAETGSPAWRSSDGSQFTTKYRIRRFMKKGIQSRIVPSARPSVKRYFTGIGLRRSSCDKPNVQFRSGKVRRNARHDFGNFPVIGSAHFQKAHRLGKRQSRRWRAPAAMSLPHKRPNRQPQRGSRITQPTNPPSIAPSGMPQIRMLTYTESSRFGAYSDNSATTLESAPPRPSP